MTLMMQKATGGTLTVFPKIFRNGVPQLRGSLVAVEWLEIRRLNSCAPSACKCKLNALSMLRQTEGIVQ